MRRRKTGLKSPVFFSDFFLTKNNNMDIEQEFKELKEMIIQLKKGAHVKYVDKVLIKLEKIKKEVIG